MGATHINKQANTNTKARRFASKTHPGSWNKETNQTPGLPLCLLLLLAASGVHPRQRKDVTSHKSQAATPQARRYLRDDTGVGPTGLCICTTGGWYPDDSATRTPELPVRRRLSPPWWAGCRCCCGGDRACMTTPAGDP